MSAARKLATAYGMFSIACCFLLTAANSKMDSSLEVLKCIAMTLAAPAAAVCGAWILFFDKSK